MKNTIKKEALVEILEIRISLVSDLPPLEILEADAGALSMLSTARVTMKYCNALINAVNLNEPAKKFQCVLEDMQSLLLDNRLRGGSTNEYSNAVEATEREVVSELYRTFKDLTIEG